LGTRGQHASAIESAAETCRSQCIK
jgi:hypothetical protein